YWEEATMVQRVLFVLAVLAVESSSLLAQTRTGKDSTIVFQPIDANLVNQTSYKPLLNAWGFDLLMSNNGFGAGFFLRREYTDELAGFISFAISDVKDEGEVEYFNYWTGQSYIPNKVNRLIYMPLVAGIQYRLFKDDIVDNFRPYLTAGIGPSLVFVAPYATPQIDPTTGQPNGQFDQIDFFSSLKYGRLRYTAGGYIGAGAYFGLDKGSLSGLNIRYYFSPFPNGIQVMTNSVVKNFGGLYITLSFGTLY
ncbi:MAG TPA: hypothetical protein VI758_03480, partial [Bacteroidota bacterium]